MAAVMLLLATTATVLTGCTHTAHVRPSSIMIACGDGNFYITKLHWTRWAASIATATGIAHRNDCVPDCAGGRFHTFRVSVRLSNPVVCVAGRREFATIRWRSADTASSE